MLNKRDKLVDSIPILGPRVVDGVPSGSILNKAKPVALKDFNLDGLLCRLERVDPKLYPSLYRVELHDEINQNIKIDWLYLKAENDEQPHWGTAQIFIAEQLYEQGQFSHYVVLIGTHSVDYAITVLQAYTDQRHTRTSSIHQTTWTTFKKFYQLRSIDLSSNNLVEFPICLKEC